MEPATPPPPAPKVTLLRAVASFVVGAVVSPVIFYAAVFLGSCFASALVEDGGRKTVLRIALLVLMACPVLFIPLVLLASFTRFVFKKIPGSVRVYASGVVAPFFLFACFTALSKEMGWALVSIAVGLVLSTVAWVSARRGIRLYAKAFKEGVGTTCAHCHYDLSDAAERAVCPECGGTLRYNGQ